FVLAGEGFLAGQLAEAIERHGLSGRVRLLGFVESAHAFYRAVDVVVIPSRIEGLPLVLLEAMALCKPVIAADVGMVGEVIATGSNGITYPSGDLDLLEAG